MAALAGFSGTASAHASLESTDPTANSLLDASPTEVVLTFSERVNPLDDSIQVVAGDGTPVDIGSIRQDGGKSTLAADVPTLPDGTYVVAWKAISADSHPVSGAFTFSVGTPSTTDPNLVKDLLTQSETSAGDQAGLATGRALGFAGMAMLLGGLAVALWCIPGDVGGRRTGIVVWIGLIAGLVGSAVMISAQAATTVGRATDWGAVGDTDAGRWWLARLVVFALAAPVVALRRHHVQRLWQIAAVAVGIALVCTSAAGGHGITGRLVALGFAATVVHLVAMSLWVGGIGVLLAAPRDRMLAVAVRFSPVALVSVASLAITGAVNAWRQSDSLSSLVHSSYGRWLIFKLVVVVTVVMMAALSRRLVGRSEESAEVRTPRLRRTVAMEAIGMVIVLVATAGLVSSPPPVDASKPSLATADIVQDDRIAQVTLDPAVSGGTTVHVYISSASGSFEQPTEIKVTATLPAQQLGPIELPLSVAGPGHLTGNGIDFPFPGLWRITVIARYGDFDATTFSTDMEIT